jgi:hypothetical protein
MNEESYCSDEDCDNDSASMSNDGPDNMKNGKKMHNRSYMTSD